MECQSLLFYQHLLDSPADAAEVRFGALLTLAIGLSLLLIAHLAMMLLAAL